MTDAANARRRAANKLGFYIHLLVFVLVNLLLVFINLSTNPDRLWFLYALGGWGVGLVCHWFAVFVGPSLMQRMTDRELDQR